MTEDLLIAGDVTARLVASTTGRDADWAVKLIDVFPDSMPGELAARRLPADGGARDHARTLPEELLAPEPLAPNTPLDFTVDLHQQSHTFRKGHRIMVQVQSTWFPVYDRNPQTWVPNIFEAKASDFKAQTHRIWHTPRYPSRIEVTVMR